MAKESAEEKLLKMMKKNPSSVAGKTAASPKKKFKFSFSIATLNALLLLAIFACLAVLVLEVRSGFALLNNGFDFSTEPHNEGSMSDIALPTNPSADYYLQKVNERNIFKPYVAKPVQKAKIMGLAQKMAKYKLVGIAWLDLPETATVMLENIQKQETFFLKQGDQIDDVTVKTIYTDRAVFSHENEEITIKL